MVINRYWTKKNGDINGTYSLVICCIAIENGPFIVDLPIQDDDFPVRYVSLPEGISLGTFTWQANWVVENTIIPSHSTAWLNAFPTNGYNNPQ